MGLFTRRLPLLPPPVFVLTVQGWMLFTEAVATLWPDLAATAWEGYQTSGRGAVLVDFSTEKIDYIPFGGFDAFRRGRGERPDRQLQDLCSRYKPDRELVMMTRGAPDAKAAQAGETEAFVGVLSSPEGLPTPPRAYEIQRTSAAAREYIEARMRQIELRQAQRQGTALDPDSV